MDKRNFRKRVAEMDFRRAWARRPSR
ncbi:hypothetical protein [Sutterella wadsworthensis]